MLKINKPNIDFNSHIFFLPLNQKRVKGIITIAYK